MVPILVAMEMTQFLTFIPLLVGDVVARMTFPLVVMVVLVVVVLGAFHLVLELSGRETLVVGGVAVTETKLLVAVVVVL
jgi:hypothetical protein